MSTASDEQARGSARASRWIRARLVEFGERNVRGCALTPNADGSSEWSVSSITSWKRTGSPPSSTSAGSTRATAAAAARIASMCAADPTCATALRRPGRDARARVEGAGGGVAVAVYGNRSARRSAEVPRVAVVLQVGVLDRTVAEHARGVLQLILLRLDERLQRGLHLLRLLGVARAHALVHLLARLLVEGAVEHVADRAVEQVRQLHDVAGARLVRLAVLAVDRAEATGVVAGWRASPPREGITFSACASAGGGRRCAGRAPAEAARSPPWPFGA